eukprot:9913710-Alexandrium_andersonii.AAC.1
MARAQSQANKACHLHPRRWHRIDKASRNSTCTITEQFTGGTVLLRENPGSVDITGNRFPESSKWQT